MKTVNSFENYLSNHYQHIGNQERYRKNKKLQLYHTYKHLLPVNKNARILDIGPGYGQMLELLSKDLSYKHVQAIDVSKEVVDFCNTIVTESTLLVNSTEEFLSTKNEYFECLLLFHVLEHIPKSVIPEFLHSIHDSLTDNGRFIVEVPNMANPLVASHLRYADYTHEIGFTELSIRSVLRNAHFVDIEVFNESFPINHPKRVLALIFRKIAEIFIKTLYKGYELSVPQVLSPSLCVTAVRRKNV